MIKTIGIKKENILQGIDFTMKQGEMVAVMGPSGSGKSTLMYMLSGMDKVSEGKIFFQGKDITSCSEEESARMRLQKMGFVFQQMNMLPNLSILDNIILPAIEYQKQMGRKSRIEEKELIVKARKLMEKVGISGLEDRKISEVSGGQLQRACICRALMNDPEILFADEPTGALNRSASEEVMKELVRLNREGMSILIVTHDSKVASCCSRVLYLLDGKIAGEYRANSDAYHGKEDLGKENPGKEYLRKENPGKEDQVKERNEKRLNSWLAEHDW
ncbi:MAG: ABC transporter ATP-binding protein [Lachnospiraceae bacterium]